uniref:Uncharacterized protein n=1 Tax=Photinus pyralis TaxID=7054 RepID=A0A1Y1MQ63_PHOPY
MPSLKKSPVHLAAISVKISGKANEIFPVVSMIITVRLIVILTTPPNCAAAPISAYLPGCTSAVAFGKSCNKPTATRRPHAAPVSNVGMNNPIEHASPKVAQDNKK